MVIRSTARSLWFGIAFAMIFALSSFDSDPSRIASALEPDLEFVDESATVTMMSRQVCSLLNGAGNGASIKGQDEIGSIRVGNTSYWVFGDTELTGNLGWIPNNIATTSDADLSDCTSLTHKASGGVALPLLPKSPVETSEGRLLWPTTMVAAAPSDVHFFYARLNLPPDSLNTTYVGLATFDPVTLEATRLGDPVEGEPFWPAPFADEIDAVRALVVDDFIYAFLLHNASGGQSKLARVSVTDIEDVTAYTYWDNTTQSFVTNLADADFVETNGMISWNEFLGKWIAVDGIFPFWGGRIRVADRVVDSTRPPWGAWSDFSYAVDCAAHYQLDQEAAYLGYCYSVQEHGELSGDGGRTIYVTISNAAEYRIFVHELKLAKRFLQYTNAAGDRRIYIADGATPPAGFGPVPDGAAFYAGTAADAGLIPITKWVSNSGEIQYEQLTPGGGFTSVGVAFYAAAATSVAGSDLAYDPVYRWDEIGDTTNHVYSHMQFVGGYTRAGSPSFYLPCPQRDADALSDCGEQRQGTDPLDADTDNDGHRDEQSKSHRQPLTPEDERFDNCPLIANASQENSDDNFIDLSPPKLYDDATLVYSDAIGDVCDADKDNDGLSDAAEMSGSLCGGLVTNSAARDTDGDNYLDLAECSTGTNPNDVNSRPTQSQCGATTDVDGDGLVAFREFCFYRSDPGLANTDGDGCNDGREVASINGDTAVSVVDLQQISLESGAYVLPGSPVKVNFDITKDGNINVTDLQQASAQTGQCP